MKEDDSTYLPRNTSLPEPEFIKRSMTWPAAVAAVTLAVAETLTSDCPSFCVRSVASERVGKGRACKLVLRRDQRIAMYSIHDKTNIKFKATVQAANSNKGKQRTSIARFSSPVPQ